MGEETYRVRWSDMDLPDYLKQMQERADRLRRDARVLTERADQIEEERRNLDHAMEVVPAAAPDAAP